MFVVVAHTTKTPHIYIYIYIHIYMWYIIQKGLCSRWRGIDNWHIPTVEELTAIRDMREVAWNTALNGLYVGVG